MAAYRGLKDLGQTTTAAAEGFNASIKSAATASRRDRRGRTVPWLLWLIYDTLEPKFQRVRMSKELGGVLNTKQMKVARAAIEAAAEVPDSSITVLDAELGHCTVLSVSRADFQYDVRDVRSSEPHCDCPQGLRGRLCKHAVACMLLLGSSKTEVWQLHGSLHGAWHGSTDGSNAPGLGVGIVGLNAPPASSPAMPPDTQPVAPTQQADRTVDNGARAAAALGEIQLLLSSSSPCDPWLRSDVANLERALGQMHSARRACDDEARQGIVSLRDSRSTRPDIGLQRMPDLLGRIMKGAGGSGKRQRVEPDPPTSPIPGELVELRDAPQRGLPKPKTLKEQVATLGDDEEAEAVVVQASQGMRSMTNTLPAAEAPPFAEPTSFMALLLSADSP